MEIVHVVRQYAPSVGGLEDAVQNLCLHLTYIPGVTVRIVTLNRVFTNPATLLRAEETIDGIKVTRIAYRGSRRYPIAPGILKVLSSADIIHVHAIDWFFDFLALTKIIHRKPLVASTHGGYFHTAFAAALKKKYFQTVTRLSCQAYRAICASSENDATRFRLISPSNVITVENGVNIKKWKDRGSKTLERKMIFIGRWSANKRISLLIELITHLRALGADWQLYIVGLPFDNDLETLTVAAEKSGVRGAVHFSIAPTQEQIGELIGSTSYIASASEYEGFGLSIVEGMSAGLIPLVSPIPPFKRLLDMLGGGEVIIPDRLADSAAAIERRHQNSLAQTEILRAQCMALTERYDWRDVASRFYEVYKKALVHS